MGLQGVGSSNSAAARTHHQGPEFNLMPGQGNLYGLALDEVQKLLGDIEKPLTSMCVDEFLMSLWTAESRNQATGVSNEPTLNHPSNPQSSLGLSRDLNKTVNELWQGIQQEQINVGGKSNLGEMTLEEFLVKVGVVAESSSRNIRSSSVYGIVDPLQHGHWSQHQIPEMHRQQQQSLLPVFGPGNPIQQPISTGGSVTQLPIPNGENMMIDAAYCDMEFIMSPTTLKGTSSWTRNLTERGVPSGGAKRINERRMKRLIKNRESAARSRARKHAYQIDLERKVLLLEEENRRLKQMKEIELLFLKEPVQEPRYQLRRTSSALR